MNSFGARFAGALGHQHQSMRRDRARAAKTPESYSDRFSARSFPASRIVSQQPSSQFVVDNFFDLGDLDGIVDFGVIKNGARNSFRNALPFYLLLRCPDRKSVV